MEESRNIIEECEPSSNEELKLFTNDNKEKENESFHFSKVIMKESDIKENSEERQKLFSTKVFMKSIDLRCEDHLSKFQEDMEATRFCEKCNILCCDSCVIDYHVDHIALAKKKSMNILYLKKNI